MLFLFFWSPRQLGLPHAQTEGNEDVVFFQPLQTVVDEKKRKAKLRRRGGGESVTSPAGAPGC